MSSRFTPEQILQLVKDQERENVKLDYKSIGALTNNDHNKQEISKDISAFANSAGGTIIYGVYEENHIPQGFDGTKGIESKKEWLEQVINSNIYPRIEDINVYCVPIEDNVVIVVSISESYTAHQANDHRYYHRYGSESLAMEDYQVKQTMNKANQPLLKLRIRRNQVFPLPIKVQHKQRDLEFYVKNEGRITAKSCVFHLYIPNDIPLRHQGEWQIEPTPGYRHFVLSLTRNEHSVLDEMKIHPGQEFSISESNQRNRVVLVLEDHYAKHEAVYYGKYEFFGENMTPISGELVFRFEDGKSIIDVN